VWIGSNIHRGGYPRLARPGPWPSLGAGDKTKTNNWNHKQQKLFQNGKSTNPEMRKKNSMNTIKHIIGKFGIVLCSVLLGCATYGQVSVSVGVEIRAESDFYEPLAPHGEWVVVGSYGRCWRPGHIDRDWRPYSEGYWQRTDAGWYWVSDEPWAWATYHYGRWNFTDQYGWYWVPQTVWAPAWVSWHSGGGYIGWAPLYPSGVRVISPQAYVFVEERHFTEPVRRSTVVVNNTTIINKTVINEAPATAAVEKASGRKVQAVPVQELRHKQEAAFVAKQKTPTAVTPTATTPTAATPTAATPTAATPTATSEKTVQPSVRSAAETSEKKTVPAVEPAQVQKPAATMPKSAATAPENSKAQSETRKSVPVVAESKPVAKPDAVPAAKPAAKPEAKPVVIKESTGQKTNSQPVIHGKSSQPSDKKEQQTAEEKPAASEKSAPNPADNDHENKPKE
jgi:Family of unknown function (DUF6600)